MSSAADGAASEAPAAAGIWGNAQQVPGLAALNTGGDAWVISVSCPAAGECAASGRHATPAFGEPSSPVKRTASGAQRSRSLAWRGSRPPARTAACCPALLRQLRHRRELRWCLRRRRCRPQL